jgi:hypothetical protein
MAKSSLKVERLTLRAQQRNAAVSGFYSAAELYGSDAMQRAAPPPPTSFMYFGWKHNIRSCFPSSYM